MKGSSPTPIVDQVDHLLFAASELEQGMDIIESLLGTRPVLGGSHPGYGTHNALLGLGKTAYLEVIAPDPKQQVDHVWMGIDQLENPRLFRWAAIGKNLQALREQALRQAIDIGEVKPGSRRQTNGQLLEWELTDPNVMLGNGLVPFFIDWGAKGNPTPTLPAAGTLLDLRGHHSDPEHVQGHLQKLNLSMKINRSEKIGLMAVIDCPNGRVELA